MPLSPHVADASTARHLQRPPYRDGYASDPLGGWSSPQPAPAALAAPPNSVLDARRAGLAPLKTALPPPPYEEALRSPRVPPTGPTPKVVAQTYHALDQSALSPSPWPAPATPQPWAAPLQPSFVFDGDDDAPPSPQHSGPQPSSLPYTTHVDSRVVEAQPLLHPERVETAAVVATPVGSSPAPLSIWDDTLESLHPRSSVPVPSPRVQPPQPSFATPGGAVPHSPPGVAQAAPQLQPMRPLEAFMRDLGMLGDDDKDAVASPSHKGGLSTTTDAMPVSVPVPVPPRPRSPAAAASRATDKASPMFSPVHLRQPASTYTREEPRAVSSPEHLRELREAVHEEDSFPQSTAFVGYNLDPDVAHTTVQQLKAQVYCVTRAFVCLFDCAVVMVVWK